MLHGNAGPEGRERALLRHHHSRAAYAALPSARPALVPRWLGKVQDRADGYVRRPHPRLPHAAIPRVRQRSEPPADAGMAFVDIEHA